MKTLNQLKKLLKDYLLVDRMIYSVKEDVFKFRRFYFYRHGMDSEKFKNSIVKSLNELLIEHKIENVIYEVVDYRDNYNPWPKDSYFEVIVKFQIN